MFNLLKEYCGGLLDVVKSGDGRKAAVPSALDKIAVLSRCTPAHSVRPVR